MEGRSLPLHGAAVVERSEASVQLEPGSLLIGFSDGLVERRGESLDAGMVRLEATAREVSNRSASEICDILVEEMGVATIREDDVVVIAIRYEASLAQRQTPSPLSVDRTLTPP
jgi:serine phosphatase RsbU (regulator of sigma subunit)